MNNNLILRASNLLFVFCGYQIQWFSVEAQLCKLSVASVIYLVLLAFWYAACFRQHFLDSSVFNFLITTVPILHKIIRLHLLMGLKVWILVIFEMKNVTKGLNDLMKTLPLQTDVISWSLKDLRAYICLFSGLLINIGFAFYIMCEMKFRLPTLNQIMHGSAMFLPHFALACSFKLLNLASLFSRSELQNAHSKINKAIKNEASQEKNLESVRTNGQNLVEFSTLSQPIDLEIEIPELETLQILVKRLEGLVYATRAIQKATQKQMLFLFIMNSISLLGAVYSIVYYRTTWYLILDERIGNSFYVFNIGVLIFIFWDYISLCAVNYGLKNVRSEFLKDLMQVLRSNLPLEDNKRVLLKDMKYLLRNNFNMRIFFNIPITWQTLLTVNTQVGLAIAIFITFHYLNDNIENLESQINADGD